MNNELENLARELVSAGHNAQEVRNIASQYLSNEELKTLWSIPRQNITNFVLGCFESIDLKSPFLDLGCGKRGYRPEATEKFGAEILYIALDHYLPDDKTDSLRLPNLLANTAFIPLTPLSVNTVICTEVLEHVENDNQVLGEISQVIKESGILILTLPGTDIPKHEKPPYQIDYRRYNLDSVRNLLELHHLNVLHLERKTLFGLEINLFAVAQKALI